MVLDLLGLSSVGGIVWLVVQALIIFAVIIVSGRIIAHHVGIKHALIMSFAAFFLVPLIIIGLSFGGYVLPQMQYLIPLVVWIILGEILLEGDLKNKAIVGAIAYVAYLALSFSGIGAAVVGMVPF